MGPVSHSPVGDCVSSGPDYYMAACASLAASCELYSFCKRVPAGGAAPAPVPPPVGACISNDPVVDYSAACAALQANCEQYAFCRRSSSLVQAAEAPAEPPAIRHPRLRRAVHRVLLQQRSVMQQAHQLAAGDDHGTEHGAAVGS